MTADDEMETGGLVVDHAGGEEDCLETPEMCTGLDLSSSFLLVAPPSDGAFEGQRGGLGSLNTDPCSWADQMESGSFYSVKVIFCFCFVYFILNGSLFFSCDCKCEGNEGYI